MVPRVAVFAMAGFAAILLMAQAPAESPFPTDSDVRKILADRIGGEDRGVGLVVGLIDAKGRRVVSYGSLAKGDKRPLNGETVFEIGSMTKVFTSLVLMDMVLKGEVALTDPVAKYLPDGVKIPERDGKKITLEELSTQHSGLPRMPTNFEPKDPSNPYADYTPERLYKFLSGYQLTRDIGAQYEYSNLGVGLLGYALTLRTGKNYEGMVRSRICDSLGMNSTRVALTPTMKARLATGHGPNLNAVSNWDLAETVAGAGALRSTANDILIFLSANLGYTKTPLAAAITKEVSIRRSTGTPNMEIAYAWHVLNKEGRSIIWHNGGTGGYRTFMGFDPKAGTGVVVLANYSTLEGPDDIGRHLLDASYPLSKVAPMKEHKEVSVESKVFDNYVGSYQLAPTAVMAITRDGEQLFEQLSGQPKAQIFPEGDRKFFLKVVDAQITFDVDAEGKATQLTLHQNGRDMPAKRISEEQVTALKAALEKRIKEQTAAPGTEAAIRRNIEELRKGEPNYDLMTPAMADVTRQQLPQLKTIITQLGEVQAVTFKGVADNGADKYEVKFANGTTSWIINLDANGKVAGVGFRPQ
ncbi:MAG TPA: serine hydrolase [Bryobacteraceae bacterium]|jgi:CubicO group peptidase (beta-lactamase class C family)